MTLVEMCRFKLRSQEPTSAHVYGQRWRLGVFVCVGRRTGQYMVYSDDQVRLERTVVRVPDADKWCKESLSAVRCTPWDLHVPRETEIIFKEKMDRGEGNFMEKTTIARQPYISAVLARDWLRKQFYEKMRSLCSTISRTLQRMDYLHDLLKACSLLGSVLACCGVVTLDILHNDRLPCPTWWRTVVSSNYI